MAVNVATLKATVTADIGQFTAGMNAAQNTMKKAAAEADKAKKHFDDLAERLNKLGSILTIGVTSPLIAFGRAAVDATVRMDSLKRGLTAVAGSAAEAEKQLVRLKEIAKLPGLSFEGAIKGSIRLQAAGISAAQAEKSLRAFGNAIATVGGSSAELDGVTRALSQIQSKGKVLAEEINQLAERVPQVRAAMIRLYGTADTEILQKAKLTSQEFISTLTDELAKAKPVVGGLQNTFENAQQSINESLDRIGKALAPLVAFVLEKFVPALEKITKAFEGLPKETKNLAIAIGALTVAGGPILLLTGQILELGKAIGIARLAALGPVAGIAALIGVGAIAGLSAWNSNMDKQAAEANTTAAQSAAKRMAEIDKELPLLKNQLTYKFRIGTIGLKEEAAKIKALEEERVTQANLYLMAMTKNEQVYQANVRKMADANLAAQKKKAEELAAIQKRILEAKTAKEREEAEAARKRAAAEAKRLAAEAERIRKVNEGLTLELMKLTKNRYDVERFEARIAFQDALRDSGSRIRAAEVLAAKLADINRRQREELMETSRSVSESFTRMGEGLAATFIGARGSGNRIAAGKASGLLGQIGEALTNLSANMGKAFDEGFTEYRRRGEIAIQGWIEFLQKAAAGNNAFKQFSAAMGAATSAVGQTGAAMSQAGAGLKTERQKEIDAFFQDFSRQARQSSRELLRSILGGRGRDRQDIFQEFFEGMKNAFVEAIINSPLERLKKVFEPIAIGFGNALQEALVGAVKVAQSGVGQMLGAVYQLLSALRRKGGLNFGSVLGGIAAGVFLGPASIPFGMNVGGQLYEGNLGGALQDTAFHYATGGFNNIGGSGGGWQAPGGPGKFTPPPTNIPLPGQGVNRSQTTQIINIGVQNINDKADSRRLTAEFNQRLENQIQSRVK